MRPIGERKSEPERTALPWLALHPDAPAVRSHDPFAYGEAETRSRATSVRLPERIEQVGNVGRIDPGPLILDEEAKLAVPILHADYNRAALGRELDGIANQVGEDLLDSMMVSTNPG